MIPGNDVCFLHQLFIIFLTAGGSVPVISVIPSTLNVIEGVIWMPCCWRPDSYNSLVTWKRSAFLVIFVREWRANHFLNEAWRRRNLLLQSCEQIRSQGCTCNIECWKRYYLGPVHTYQEIFESATFSLRIRLLSTHIRCIRHTNPFAKLEIFEYAMNPESRGR